ncbi:amino acid ABC transporter substrate-binding protein [Stutzerimonas stutzeri]|uniref:Amino acid ABC transporter substrate-binding protein n=1 Tax=Stutzerimonas stutzeri TaxID=316 RepID=W8R2M7_STUST|nr:amino acid ABC transporter substrate-binding protein [Stutzerimonas stutzeri]
MDRQPVSSRVLDEAIAWQLRLGDETAGPHVNAELQRWLSDNAEHAKAWAQLGGIDQQLGSINSPSARHALQVSATSKRRRTTGRAFLGLVLLGTVGVGLTLQSQPLPVWLADERTGSGEQQSLTLADHSHIQLNSRSALDIRFDEHQRRLLLHQGEILIETASGNDPRPFIVETEQGDLRALGTRFIVRRERDATRLIVLRSAVAALPGGLQAGRTLQAGEQVVMYRDHLGDSQQAPIAADAWSRGMLVVEDLPLSELLAKLGEYRHGYLGLDPSLESLRISGSFPLHDTDRALAALPPSLPVRIERHTDWWVKVVPTESVAHPGE